MKCFFNNKHKISVSTLLFCIFTLFYFCTICYSALSSTMNISGVGFSRVEADVRITDFSIEDTTNSSISMYENFTKDTISSEINLKANSSITYSLEITNYGSVDVGIYSISGIPDGVNYSIEGYNLKDKICDDSGKCNSFIKKTYELTLSSTSAYSGSIQINFDFRTYHKVTYTGINIDSSYPTEVMDGTDLVINFKENAPKYIKVLFDDVETNDYTYENGILTINKVLGNVLIQAVSYDFDYSGNYETFVIPESGLYRLEVWGGQGGSYNSTYYGGYGAYAVGDMSFNKDTTLYIFPAGKGINSSTNGGNVIGGYNGGGWTNTTWDSSGDSTEYKQSGGGASHVSLENNVLAQTQDKSKILIVAAGGSGAIYFVDYTKQYYAYCIGGHGGGVVGSIATCSTNLSSYLRTYSAATQSEGGLSNYNGYVFTGSFGKGGLGYCGGGAGYYGGAGGYLNNGGGSSYIGNTNLTNKYMSCYNCSTNTTSSTKTVSTSNVSETPISGYAKSGNGYVRITPMNG